MIDFKNIYDENKKSIFLCIGMIGISLIFSGINIIINGNTYEEELKNKLGILGSTYYQKIYHLEASEEELEELKYTGLKVKLSELIDAIYYEDPKEFVNDKTKKSCNYNTSNVIIYPYSPYGEDDYKMKVNLECGY